MSKINTIIPAQGFEVARNRIGEIIADELANQSTLSANPAINATVYLERFVPFDKTELPAVNVTLSQGSYANKKAPDGVATYNYFVDIYCASKSNDSNTGDKRASFNMQRIAGIVRYILNDPQYRTLLFAPPFITRVSVLDFNIKEPSTGGADGSNIIMGRLNIEVLVVESQDLLIALILDGQNTSIKLEESDSGFFYQI